MMIAFICKNCIVTAQNMTFETNKLKHFLPIDFWFIILGLQSLLMHS